MFTLVCVCVCVSLMMSFILFNQSSLKTSQIVSAFGNFLLVLIGVSPQLILATCQATIVMKMFLMTVLVK